MPKHLRVFLSQDLVGQFTQEDDGRFSFTYHSDWLTSKNPAALSHALPLRKETFGHAAAKAFFGALLPEGDIRDRLARVLRVSKQNDFSLLAEIGGDCAGAVSLHVQGKTPSTAAGLRQALTPIQLEALLAELPIQPLLSGSGLRLSLAGAQNKLALVKEGATFFLPASGEPTTHLLKISPRIFKDMVYNELYCLRLARILGIQTPEASIDQGTSTIFLCIKRYDRSKDAQGRPYRLHQEDFCQALGIATENKYQREGGPGLIDCVKLIKDASGQPALDLNKFLNLIYFNYLIGNADAHSKNFSFLRHQGEVALAPAYDLVSTAVYKELDVKMAMKIGSRYKPGEVELRHWLKLAGEMDIKEKYVIQNLKAMAAQTLDLAPALAVTIQKEVGKQKVIAEILKIIQQRANAVLND